MAGHHLGHTFIPPGTHAGGLRYHGTPALARFAPKRGASVAPSVSALVDHAATCAGPLVNNLDQRGVARPIDGDDVLGAVCDIGAFEAPPPVWLLYVPVILR